MDDKKLGWIKNYIDLNKSREGKKMLLDDSGRERDLSVVMNQTEFDLKVAINCEYSVCVKHLCVFEGVSDYHISKEYFNMCKFNN